MPTSMDKLVEAFPQLNIPPIVGVPTYETISEVIIMLSYNAASVSTNLGCGTLGYLVLVVTPAMYNTLSATPFVPTPQSRRGTYGPTRNHRHRANKDPV